MANLHKNIDLYKVYEELKREPNPLITLMSIYYGLTFEKKGNRHTCTQHSGIAIEPVRGNTNIYTLNNYSDALGIKAGIFKTQIFNLTKQYSGLEKVEKQIEILSRCGLIEETTQGDYKTTQKTPVLSDNSRKKVHKQAETIKRSKKPVFVPYSRPYAQEVAAVLRTKTGADLETLKKYKVHACTSLNEIRYCYEVGSTIKSKFPHRSRKNNKFSVYGSTKDYLFGYEQLPEKGEFLILSSGEDDTICINHFFNELGIYAVCSWNEKTPPSKTQYQDLKSRFKYCFVLGDNDSDQMTEASRKISQETGFIWVDTSSARQFFNLPKKHDICDIYKHDKETLKSFLMFCIHTNQRIGSNPNDPYSLAVDHCLKIDFKQYIGEQEPNQYGIVPTDFIFHQIEHNEKLIIDSLAGTGKSTLMTILTDQGARIEPRKPNLKRFEKVGITQVVILEPTTAINSQLFNSFIEQKLIVSRLDGSSSQSDLLTAMNSPVILCCYDSLKRLIERGLDLDKTAVIVDEFHQLVIDIGYRNSAAFQIVLEVMKSAKRTLSISATPDLFFAQSKELSEYFGYKLIKGVQSVQNSIKIRPVYWKGTQRDLLHYIVDNAPQKEGLITIKLDSKNNNQAFAKALTNRGLKADSFNSGDRERKEDNANYKELMKSGTVSLDLDVLVFTSLLEAGVSIKTPVRLNALIDTNSWQKGIQLVSRARYNAKTGVNKEHTVWMFRSFRAEEGNEEEYNKTDVLEQFAQLSMNAEQQARAASKNQGTLKHKTDADPEKMPIKQRLNSLEYEPCILSILHEIYKRSIKCDFETMLERMKRFDNRIEVSKADSINTKTDKELAKIRDAQEADKEQAMESFKQLLTFNFDKVAQTICYLSSDTNFKQEIREVLKLPPIDRITVKQFLEQSQGAFKGREPKRILKDVIYFVDRQQITPLEAISFVLDDKSSKKYIQTIKSATERKIRYYNAQVSKDIGTMDVPEWKLDGKEYLILAREKEIIKQMDMLKDNIKRGKRKESRLTGEQIQKHVNAAIKRYNKQGKGKEKELSKKKAIDTLKDLYFIERKQFQVNKKRTWMYEIKDRKVYMKDALEFAKDKGKK